MKRFSLTPRQTHRSIGILAIALVAWQGLAAALDARQPNLVFIIADDIGYSDLGCYGGEIETPNLDRLAAGGLRFTNYYVNNMCRPTRASLMTGLFAKSALARQGPAGGGIHPDSTTLSETLRNAGYTTLMSGKWHLSSRHEPDGPNTPHHRGFDHFYGTLHGASDYFAPTGLQLDGASMRHEWEDNPDYYYTDAITDHALRFLGDRNATKPFFLYVAYTAAHWPLHARPADIEHYRGRYSKGWDELRKSRHARMKQLGAVDSRWELSPRHDAVPAWEDEENQDWQQRRMEVYAAQITCMDRNIGRILEYLDETGQTENTLIVFQHDNGGCHVEYTASRHGPEPRFTTDGHGQKIEPGNIVGLIPGPQSTFQSYGYGWANASNTPFRRFKQFDHEGGTRSPLIVSWPDRIGASRRGGIVDDVHHVIDMMPTLLDASGATLEQQQPLPLEGQSFLPTIEGRDENEAASRTLFWSHSRGRAVRVGDWKLVSLKTGPWELYNVRVDGTELHDLADQRPDKVQQLKELFTAWTERTNPNPSAER